MSWSPYNLIKIWKKLTIAFYGGSKFQVGLRIPPSQWWNQLSKIAKKCMLVPTLGGLSLLDVLCIQGMGKVKSIGAEFYV